MTGKTSTTGSDQGITTITTSGYKSIYAERSLEIRPLTILAGSNSSGKSSIMQSLLLLKQTLEATYDPGPLLLHGPNVRFNSADQLFSQLGKSQRAEKFEISVASGKSSIKTSFVRNRGLSVAETSYSFNSKAGYTLAASMSPAQVAAAVPKYLDDYRKMFDKNRVSWEMERDRCFLVLRLSVGDSLVNPDVFSLPRERNNVRSIIELIHLPGLRGNPERAYPVSAIGSIFPGTFEIYTASLISKWSSEKDEEKLQGLGTDLKRLGLTWKVTTNPINDTQVELQVGRLPQPARGGARDMVNIADVGFGVSQTLPVLVALQAAQKGQLVYLEQPEIHLHPNAQYKLADVLAEAAQRGIRLVVETHSHLIILAIQALIAEGKLDPKLVQLHWFTRDKDGVTEVTSSGMDNFGRYGDWPEDFGQIAMHAESRYLDSALQGCD